MRRRDFITLLGGAAATWPVIASAQQSSRRIGILMGTAESDPDQQALVSTFVHALGELGWRDGENIHIDYGWAAGDANRLQSLAAELASRSPDAILVQGTPAATVLRRAAPTTPTVFVMVTDPISSGLVASLARPGGNITGFTNYELATSGKWLEILKEVAPAVTRVAVLHNPENPALTVQLRAIEAAAPGLGVEVTAAPVRSRADIEPTIAVFAQGAKGGLLVLVDFITLAQRELIIKLAEQHRLPSMFNVRAFVRSGGLLSYAIDPSDLFRRAAAYVDRILKGAQAADLPVQQPTKFELVVNLKAAKALGLKIPETFLLRADEVIE
jgi:ABC-type uncharacterized transport system substrate-binding protein